MKTHVCSIVVVIAATLTTQVRAQFTYTTNNGTITITGYTGADGNVVIPATINELPVTRIGSTSFQYSGLGSVTIPNSVTNIGTSAFFGCKNLQGVTIPDSVTYLGGGAFYGCTSMTSASIGNGVPDIKHDMFNGCNLEHVTIGNSVMNIESYASLIPFRFPA